MFDICNEKITNIFKGYDDDNGQSGEVDKNFDIFLNLNNSGSDVADNDNDNDQMSPERCAKMKVYPVVDNDEGLENTNGY